MKNDYSSNYFVGELPEILDKEEQIKLIKDYKINNNLEAREKLIIHNLRMVAHIVNKFIYAYPDHDLFNIGTVSLIKAIDMFDYEKSLSINTNLSTYIHNSIKNNILLYLSRSVKKDNERLCSLDEPLPFNDKSGDNTKLSRADSLVDETFNSIDHDLILNEEIKYLYKAMDGLTKNERSVLIIKYDLNNRRKNSKEISDREVGELLNFSRAYVAKCKSIAFKKIKLYFNKVNKNLI